jgi:hypothetical protein
MHAHITLLTLCLPLALANWWNGSSYGTELPNVKAKFGSSPARFEIDVDPVFVEELRLRVYQARAPIPIEGLEPEDDDGPILANFTSIKDYWTDEYNWEAVQESINQRSVEMFIQIKKANLTAGIAWNSILPLSRSQTTVRQSLCISSITSQAETMQSHSSSFMDGLDRFWRWRTSLIVSPNRQTLLSQPSTL